MWPLSFSVLGLIPAHVRGTPFGDEAIADALSTDGAMLRKPGPSLIHVVSL